MFRESWSDSPRSVTAVDHGRGENTTCTSNNVSASSHEVIEYAIGGQWAKVRDCIGKLGPSLSIELACRISSLNPPQSVIVAIKCARSQVFTEEDKFSRQPLHYLCKHGAPTYSIIFATQCNTSSLDHPDKDGKTPIDYLVSTPWEYCADTKDDVMKELEQSHRVSFDSNGNDKVEENVKLDRDTDTRMNMDKNDQSSKQKITIKSKVRRNHDDTTTRTKANKTINDPAVLLSQSDKEKIDFTSNNDDDDDDDDQDISFSGSEASTDETSGSGVSIEREKPSPPSPPSPITTSTSTSSAATFKSSNPPPNVADGGVWGTAKVRGKAAGNRFAFFFIPGLGCAKDMDAYAIWGKRRDAKGNEIGERDIWLYDWEGNLLGPRKNFKWESHNKCMFRFLDML